MNIVGLVTEYNPFHNGHLHHLVESKKTTESDYAIAVMSGHFLQRGEPAIMNKWVRARNAVEAGVDLVLEIPTLFACSSAESFAYGSVALLNNLNIVNSLCFGSENKELDVIKAYASVLSQASNIDKPIKEVLKKGISYPKARELVLDQLMDKKLPLKPNNILGIEYVKSLMLLKSPIKAATIQRINAEYMSTELKGTISSATGIRHHIKKHHPKIIENFVPIDTYESLNKEPLVYPDDLGDLLLYKIRTSTAEDIKAIHDVSEGLENRIKKAAETATDYETLVSGIVTKRYTLTRIQRILIKILLGITKDMFRKYQDVPYARVLAFNEKGAKLIKRIKKESDITLITNINKTIIPDHMKELVELDIKATNVYNLLYRETHLKSGGSDYLTSPYMKKTQ